jgi:glycine/D-amino acid oxidase-like deaminating enzyme
MQTSYWELSHQQIHYDLIIIGAGFAGAWCALEYLKAKPESKILILERGQIPTGASTRNAGFACIGSATEMLSDIETMGETATFDLAEMRYAGIQKILATVKPEAINYEPCGGYELLHQGEILEKSKDKLDWINSAIARVTGEEAMFTWESGAMENLGITGFKAMLKNRCDGAIHSGKLLAELHRIIIAKGATILFGQEITCLEDSLCQTKPGKSVQIRTLSQKIFQADQILLCTNAFTHLLSKESKIIPARGQVFVTKPIPNLKLHGTFHYDEGFYYFRHLGDRILIGGARNADFATEQTTLLETTELIQKTLEQFLQNHILKDQNFEIEYRWAGVMGFTHSKMPEIFEINSKVHALIACNGMGVALLPIMAERAIARILL